MDKKISNKTKQQRKWKLLFKIGTWVSVFIAIVFFIRSAINPSIQKDDFHTGITDIGNIEASVSASGIVVPEFEEVKTSPIQSQIIKIYRNVGDKVVEGDSILSLDKKETKSSLEKLVDQLNMKKNNINQLRLQLEKNLLDLKTQFEIKKLHVENLEAKVKEEKYLNEIGGGSKEKIEKAELNYKISKLELHQIKQTIKNKEELMKVELQGLNYEINIQEKCVTELRNKLKQSTITSDKDGVIISINNHIGKTITPGEELVKIANLESYEVQGSISDMHADKLNTSKKVIVRINEDDKIRGEIASISPTITSNIITFKIRLSEKNHTLLRPNMKVDVFVITSFRENVVRVKNGAFYKGATLQDVFIVDGNTLSKRTVEFGKSNFHFIEVVKGLSKDEEIVISDMEEYMSYNTIKIKE